MKSLDCTAWGNTDILRETIEDRIMKIKTSTMNSIGMCLALFYALSTRTVIAHFIFREPIGYLYYLVLYTSMIVSMFLLSTGNLTHSPTCASGAVPIWLIGLFLVLQLLRAGEPQNILYYGIAILLPFCISLRIMQSDALAWYITLFSLVIAGGCVSHMLFPGFFQSKIVPLFGEVDRNRILWQLSNFSFPGFTSQVGYAAFYISIGIGILFCFRRRIVRNTWLVWIVVLYIALLFTGKRGAAVYSLISLLFIYFFEGTRKIRKIVYAAGIAVLAYTGLMVLAGLFKTPAIQRIALAVNSILLGRAIDSAGRDQLQAQAWAYFRESPWLGIGWDQFRRRFVLRNTYVHNIYLQLLCETGVVGLTIMMCFFVGEITHAITLLKRKRAHRLDHSWILFALYVQLLFLMLGMTENPLYDVEFFILYMFSVGITRYDELRGTS